jgi:hypothetical protein
MIFEKTQPFRRSQCNIRIDLIFIIVFDDMNILYPEAIAGAKHGTGIMGLEDIFQDHRDMARTLKNDLLKLVFLVF